MDGSVIPVIMDGQVLKTSRAGAELLRAATIVLEPTTPEQDMPITGNGHVVHVVSDEEMNELAFLLGRGSKANVSRLFALEGTKSIREQGAVKATIKGDSMVYGRSPRAVMIMPNGRAHVEGFMRRYALLDAVLNMGFENVNLEIDADPSSYQIDTLITKHEYQEERMNDAIHGGQQSAKTFSLPPVRTGSREAARRRKAMERQRQKGNRP